MRTSYHDTAGRCVPCWSVAAVPNGLLVVNAVACPGAEKPVSHITGKVGWVVAADEVALRILRSGARYAAPSRLPVHPRQQWKTRPCRIEASTTIASPIT